MVAPRNLWSKGFDPELDWPVRPSKELGAFVGSQPTTRRKIAKDLLCRFRPDEPKPKNLPLTPDLRKLLGTPADADLVAVPDLLRMIDRHVSEVPPPTPEIHDLDLVEQIQALEGSEREKLDAAIEKVLARFDELMAQSKTCDHLSCIRLYNLLALASRLIKDTEDPGEYLEDLSRRLIDLALRAKDAYGLAHRMAEVVRVLSYTWIMQLDPGAESVGLWHLRTELWNKVCSPALEMLRAPAGAASDAAHPEEHVPAGGA
jgi:hypothetical protein